MLDSSGVNPTAAVKVTPRRPSRTAVLAAVARALHRREPPPWILDDPFAMELAGDEAASVLDALETEVPADIRLDLIRWLCVRARFCEDAVERAVVGGVRQYVILGAGLDSFAYRRPDLVAQLRVFEIDHPASQAWKRQRLAEIGVPFPPGLVLAPLDFERETLAQGLRAASFDFELPSFVSLMGVTMYLTVDAIRATLRTVAECRPGSQIALTYNLPPERQDALGRRRHEAMSRLVAAMQEPWITFFDDEEVSRLLRDEGFASIELFGPEEAVQKYFPARSDILIGNVQRVALATVAGGPNH